MGVISTYFLALYLSVKCKKGISFTAPLAMMSIIIIVFAFGNIGYLMLGVYVCIAVTVASFFGCLYCVFRNKNELRKILYSPASIAYVLFIIVFCIFNIGRGFADSDDQLVWGLQLKNMCYYNMVHVKDFTSGFYPNATMMWEYFANKTWIGFAEGISLWSYDVYMVSFILPLFDFVDDKHKCSKFICICASIFVLPFLTYEIPYGRFAGNALAATMMFWGLYVIYLYWENGGLLYYFSLLMTVFCLTLTLRAGVMLTFGLFAFASFVMMQRREKHLIIRQLLMMLICVISYATFDIKHVYISVAIGAIGIVSGLALCLVIEKWNTINKERFLVCACLLVAIVCKGLIAVFDMRNPRNGEVVALFLNHVFTNSQGNAFNNFPVTLAGFIVTNLVLLFFYYRELVNRDTLSETRYKRCIWIFFTIISSMETMFAFLFAYAERIGIESEKNRLPAFPRYMSTVYLLVIFTIIWNILNEYRSKYGLGLWGALLIFCVLSVDMGRVADYLLNKYEQPQYYAFEKAGVDLKPEDKVFYINLKDESGLYDEVSFYYYVMPATSNYTRAYARTADVIIDGHESDTDSFGDTLVQHGYNYVYIQTVNDDFVQNYSKWFEGKDEILTGNVYKVVDDSGHIYFQRL